MLPKRVQLADPNFNLSSKIDILLGASVFWSSLCLGQDRLGTNMLVLQNTQFGWIIGGNLNLPLNSTSASFLNVNYADKLLNDTMVRFWQIEEVEQKRVRLTAEEQYCENYFRDTIRRNYEGRFVVKIPFKQSLLELGNSRDSALRRFELLEQKFEKNKEVKSEYCAFMLEYEKLGHMVESKDSSDSLSTDYYMPHHAVFKTSSLTSKCRVVFDASAKSSTESIKS
ncbi:hypothetical protein PPYR_14861 [Photinus pyralis]|uniref:Uncharacterized protein n=1 Tax=Photinus pyralis TaxID=7054 RepID=A0A5N4A046_PHOPY|nr:hypothetical protein PPYR_14861 [Photinus pyralis]